MWTIIKTLASSVLSWLAGGGIAVYLTCAGIGLATGGYVGWTVNGWRWESAIAAQKAEAGRTLAAETQKVLDLERKATAITARADAAYQKQQKEIEDAHDQNVDLDHRLRMALDRLRRSGRGDRGGGSAGAMSCPADGCADLYATLGKLSGAVERIARAGTELARSADREAAVATAAHQAFEEK